MLIDNILTILPYLVTVCFLFSIIGYRAENKRLRKRIEFLKNQK